MPEQFPPIQRNKKIEKKGIHQNHAYSNMIYDGFTQGKECKFTKAKR